ncbi:hypothetical protein RclHR1_04780018 [Rhizophagus clarus]|uniref:Serine-threonine/tyrosine-protein kinase catalytic domain-containing protein n=1 Tax=Rhizophagus clarus TaxID=94130 RepID=A0A2Z6RKQ3_9GLOM|nr:hypothetical protein RclHR1_04780018 [Rhizophagus clarus]
MEKCWDSNPNNRPNLESILTILNEKQYNNDKEFEVAEKYFKENKETKQITTHPQAIYASRLLDPYTKDFSNFFIKENLLKY